ncbi:MAG: PilZ domain-containing protein [Phycisphaerales bacterium]|nr:PilZ domain-containing protein [Phycisphaerales bacterium]
MVVVLDLTARQAARVLAQAVHTRAKLELEPRPEQCSELLWGTLAGRQDEALQIDLHDCDHVPALDLLVGAMCDVRTILSGQLCMFSSYFLEVQSSRVPRRLTLAVPSAIQVANRRRFARRNPTEPVPVRLTLGSQHPPYVAILANIGPQGLGCRVVSRELDDLLLIGDELQIEFVLPWCSDLFTLPAAVCSKTPCGEEGHMIVGLEFVSQGHEGTVARIAAAIDDEAARLSERGGEL